MAPKTVYQILVDFETIPTRAGVPQESAGSSVHWRRRGHISGIYGESRGNRLLARARLSQADQRVVLWGS